MIFIQKTIQNQRLTITAQKAIVNFTEIFLYKEEYYLRKEGTV